MWQRAFGIIVVVAGIALGLAIGLTSDRVADHLRQRLIELAQARYDLHLEIDTLRLGILPLSLDIDGVRLRAKGDIGDAIQAQRSSLQLRLWPSSAGALVIERLIIDGLAVDVDRWAEIKRSAGSTKFDVRRLQLNRVALRASLLSGELELDDMMVSMFPRRRGGRRIALRVGSGVVRHEDIDHKLAASLRATLQGSLDRPRALQVDRARLTISDSAIAIGGAIDFADQQPTFDLRADAELDLSELSTLNPAIPRLRGQAKPTLYLSGTLAEPELRLEVEADAVGIVDAELGKVSVDAVYAGERLLLESFEVLHPQAGRFTGSATLGVTDEWVLSGRSRLHGVLLEEILRESGIADAWVRLKLHGDLAFRGRLSPFRLETELDGHIERFETLSGSYRDSSSTQILTLDAVPIAGQARVGKNSVTVSNVSLGDDTAKLRVDGQIHYHQGLSLVASSSDFNVARVGAIANVPFTGYGPLRAEIEGPFSAITVRGDFTMDDFSILGRRLGRTSSQVDFQGSTLRFDDVAVQRARGTLRGSSRLFFGDRVRVETAADLRGIDLGRALTDLQLFTEFAPRVSATGSGVLRLHGDLAEPDGILAVRARRAAFDGVELGAMKLDIDFSPGVEAVAAKVALTNNNAKIRVRSVFRRDDRVTLSGQLAQIPLLSVTPLLGDAPLDGQLTGRFNLRGPLSSLAGSASAEVQELMVGKTPVNTTELKALIDGGIASIKATSLDGDLEALGTLRLGGRLAFSLSSSFSDVEISRLAGLESTLSSTLSGRLVAQGPLVAPSEVVADVELERWSVEFAEQTLATTQPVELHWAARTLSIREAVFRGAGIQMSARGEIGADGSLNFDVRGKGTPTRLSQLSTRITRGSGSVQFDLKAGGTIKSPRLAGSLTIIDGELALAGATELATEINAQISFSGATATIERASMKLGGGDVQFRGQSFFGGGDQSELSLRADFNSIDLEPRGGMSATVSGELGLVGPFDDLSLRGDVEIGRLRYERNVSLASLIPRRRRSSLRIPAIETSEAIALSIKLQADDDFKVINNVLNAELSADLTVTGTTNRVGLLGTLTPLSIKARYAGNVYELSRGTIDFTEEYEIFSRYNIEVQTEACGMDVSVGVYGDSESYSLSPVGNDENGAVDPQDVLLCLQFGSRSRDFDPNGAPVVQSAVGNNTSELAAAASGLDALWTVSGLDERVRDVVPIDEVRITNAWSPQANAIRPRLVLGKEIGEALRIQYWQSIVDLSPEEAYQAITIQYRLSRRTTLEGTWLSEYQTTVPVTDLGVDLRLRWEMR